MKMLIEIKVPSKSVLHHQDQRPDSILVFHPLQYRLAANGREVMQQVSVLFKNTPENVGYGKD
jgi:hypothetical protein